jgi:integrative and conjugative element protein (TIGR02256 family)
VHHLVKLRAEAARLIANEAKASADGTETGGILLGHDRSDALDVTVAGDAGPNAQRTRHYFKRDLVHARLLADQGYDHDGSVWIGEWHTHPRGPAEPSKLDRHTYMSHLADASLRFDRFLSLIVLPCSEHGWDHITVTAWVMTSEVTEAAVITIEKMDDA